MNIELINKPHEDWSAVYQILYNRGVPLEEIEHYISLSDTDICDYMTLGEECLKEGAKKLFTAIDKDLTALVIVDCDADGYTSAALLINYLYAVFPSWTANHLEWVMHEGKQHGLADHRDFIIDNSDKYSLIICPDSSSNDYDIHKELVEIGKDILVLDHHLADKISENATIINNQLSDYPNKELSGVGVTWQFCRYLDSLLDKKEANNLLDLVALGNGADMMSLLSPETKYLILKGFRRENIQNPFIDYMIDKNSFPLSKSDYKSHYTSQACTNMGAAFFITPFLNAVTRSGTLDEKELIFKSMLTHTAFTRIPEIKRNKKTGKEEALVLQAVRVIGNIKNRQTRAEEAGLEMLTNMIHEKNMLDNKILLFVLKPDEIEAEIRGLIANKFMARYQRPCIIVSYGDTECCGSMRGYTKNGLKSFKELLEQCAGVNFVQGHDNAAGVSLQTDKLDEFLADANRLMENVSGDPVYRVDYYFRDITSKTKEVIKEIASLNDFWGQDIDRSYVAIRFKVNENNFAVMKSNTLKITIDNDLSLIMFGGTDEDIENFTTTGWKEFEAVCKCNVNEWNGETYPQLLIDSYEMIDSCKYFF